MNWALNGNINHEIFFIDKGAGYGLHDTVNGESMLRFG
jgi:hypothetical protein